MNKILLTGRLTKEPEARTGVSGKNYARLSIAVRRKYKNAEGENETDFFNATAFGSVANYVAQYGVKGVMVAVVGEMQQQNYMDSNGVKKSSYCIMVESLEILEKRDNAEKLQQTAQIPDSSRPTPFRQPQAQMAMPTLQTQTPTPTQPVPDARNQNQTKGFESNDGILPFDF